MLCVNSQRLSVLFQLLTTVELASAPSDNLVCFSARQLLSLLQRSPTPRSACSAQTDLYQYYRQNPVKGARFAQVMAGFAQCVPRSSVLRPICPFHFRFFADKCHSFFLLATPSKWEVIKSKHSGMSISGRLWARQKLPRFVENAKTAAGGAIALA